MPRRSSVVAWTVIGLPAAAVGLANGFPAQDMRRNLYADRAACERDYTPQQCEPTAGSGSSGYYGSSGWHGPYYSANRAAAVSGDPGPGRTGQVTRTEISTRGGFGSFGRALHAVG